MSHNNQIDVEIELDNGQIISVNVEYLFTKGSKARKYGHPDDWHDSEGPEVDIMKMSYERPMNKEEFGKTLDDYEELIIEKIIEQEEAQ